MTRTPPRGTRTNRHLARVTTLAVAALIATQWLASAAGRAASEPGTAYSGPAGPGSRPGIPVPPA